MQRSEENLLLLPLGILDARFQKAAVQFREIFLFFSLFAFLQEKTRNLRFKCTQYSLRKVLSMYARLSFFCEVQGPWIIGLKSWVMFYWMQYTSAHRYDLLNEAVIDEKLMVLGRKSIFERFQAF